MAAHPLDRQHRPTLPCAGDRPAPAWVRSPLSPADREILARAGLPCGIDTPLLVLARPVVLDLEGRSVSGLHFLPCSDERKGSSLRPGLPCSPDSEIPTVEYRSGALVLSCGPCFDGDGVVVPAGQFVSTVSQADADAQALAWGQEHLACVPADPASFIPAWDDLSGEVSVPRVDVYGAMGFEAAAFADLPARMWCSFNPSLDFCDGPETEGVPTLEIEDRWSVRWVASQQNGVFAYSKVGQPFAPAPSELFPSPVAGAVGVSISFDANGRPGFAFEVGGTVELRRFFAGIPTTYSWPGRSPKLFFDGLLQPDSGSRDLVCYYVTNGRLCARMQRDNFATEYQLVDAPAIAGLGALESLTKADRGSGMDISRNWLAATAASGELVLFRSALYPPWPFTVREFGTETTTIDDIGYSLVIVDLGSFEEVSSQTVGLEGIEYTAAVFDHFPDFAETGTSTVSVETINYPLTAIVFPAVSEAGTNTAAVDSINYPLVSVNAGTYQEPGTATATLESISYV